MQSPTEVGGPAKWEKREKAKNLATQEERRKMFEGEIGPGW
jgi:hypothetical protein